MSQSTLERYPYPRRQVARRVMHMLVRFLFTILADVQVTGRDNLPDDGPAIMVGNHFSHLDPVAFVYLTPRPLEFFAGNQMPNAPQSVTWLTEVWGVIRVYRGNVSTEALKAGEAILAQGGLLGIFPEAGNWATILRPARPGAAYLAARANVPVVPVGLDGLDEMFETLLQQKRRPQVTLRIGAPIGPFSVSGRGPERREQLEAIGHQMMQAIAELLPPHKRGYYADDPAVREAAKGTEVYPWADEPDAINTTRSQ